MTVGGILTSMLTGKPDHSVEGNPVGRMIKMIFLIIKPVSTRAEA